jgi:two-component system, OmpR family, response regulator
LRPTIAGGGETTRILVVEDAPKLLAILTRRLQSEGYAVDAAATGTEALRLSTDTSYDVIVLDLRLPDIDGIDVCCRLRAAGRWAPVLMLTARNGVGDRVRGLDTGADDYLAKPFDFDELFARVRALARRGDEPRPACVVVGSLSLDPASRKVLQAHCELKLTAKEFALLEYFMRHPGVVIGRSRLRAHAWDGAHHGSSNVIDVYVGRLRSKLTADARVVLETVRGVGYPLGETP